MKAIVLFWAIIFAEVICCQETIDLKFKEANPIWIHTLIDTTFIPVPGQPYFTKYSSLSPHGIWKEGDDIYIMGVCSEKQSLDDYGFVLDKIDINTGIKKWSHFNTPYNQGKKDIYHNLQITKENIYMVGVEEDTNQKFYTSYKKIDARSGELLNYSRSNKELPEIFSRYFTGFVLKPDSVLLNAYTIGGYTGNINNPIINYGLDAHVFDAKLNLISVKRNLFNFDTLGFFSIDQTNYTLRLNANTLVSLAYKDRYESWDNLGTKIMWTDLSDPLNLTTRQIIDYKDIIPGTKETFSSLRFKSVNNTIFLGHRYPNFDIQTNSAYILWLDANGNIKTFIDLPYYGDHLYQFTDMIYANSEFGFLFAFPSVTNRTGFDIIKIYHGVDTIQFVSSITSLNDGEEFGTQINGLYDNNFVIFGGYTKKEGHGTKTSSKFYCFKASDLGINFEPVTSSDLTLNKPVFKIFPNPTTNILYIELEYNLKNLITEIRDLNGKLVMKNNLTEKYNLIDISTVAKGVYLINVLNEKGDQIGNVEKMVKVE